MLPWRGRAQLLISLVGVSICASCELDNRVLSKRRPPTPVSLVDASLGSRTDPVTVVEAGEEDLPDAGPPPCPDLDENGVRDEMETLLRNPGFDADHSEWVSEENAEVAWLADDGCSVPSSGSVWIQNVIEGEHSANGFAGTSQCVLVEPGVDYRAEAHVWMESGQAAGSGGISLQLYASEDCSGRALSATSGLTQNTDSWHVVHAKVTVPEEVHSVLVRVGVLKPFNADPFAVLIDNPLFKRQ